jgi:hypothetical protein
MIRRCFETLYGVEWRRSAISFTLIVSLNNSRRVRKRVSSPNAFSAAIQSRPFNNAIDLKDIRVGREASSIKTFEFREGRKQGGCRPRFQRVSHPDRATADRRTQGRPTFVG